MEISSVNFKLFVELFKWMSDFLSSALSFFFLSPVCSLSAIYINWDLVQICFSALLLGKKKSSKFVFSLMPCHRNLKNLLCLSKM